MSKLAWTIRNLYLDAANQSGSILKGINAVRKFGICQLRFLLGQKKFECLWDDDIKITIIQGEHGSTECYYMGLYDYSEMNLLKNTLREGDTFLDIGANVGTWSLLAAKQNAMVYAFEPAERTYTLLNKNIHLNPELKDKIITVNAAVGNSNDDIYFTIGNDSTCNHVTYDEEDARKMRVKQIKIDEFITDTNVFMAKIDVEGFEQQVLLGMEKMLCSDNLQIITLEDFKGKNSWSYSFLKKCGYTRCRYSVKNKELEIDEEFTGDGNNSIYIKDVDLVNGRLNGKRTQ